jgi:hypothetical protein
VLPVRRSSLKRLALVTLLLAVSAARADERA